MYSRYKQFCAANQTINGAYDQPVFTDKVEDDLKRWQGRVALVTGASAGMGKALAIELLNRGIHVVGCARRVDAMESIPDAVHKNNKPIGRFLPISCDVSKEEDIVAMFQRIKEDPNFGGVDICINNAGVGLLGAFEDGKTEAWERMLMVNVFGLSICTREAIKSMRERGVDDGHVIHISSIVGHQVIHQVGTFYCATKFAVTALTEALRQELAAEKSKIRVTQISPGLVRTEFLEVAASADVAENILAAAPHLLPADIVSQVIFALAAAEHAQIHDVIVVGKSTSEE